MCVCVCVWTLVCFRSSADYGDPYVFMTCCFKALQRHLQSGITKGAYVKFTGQLHQASLGELAYGQRRNPDRHNSSHTHTHPVTLAPIPNSISHSTAREKNALLENYITAYSAKAKDPFFISLTRTHTHMLVQRMAFCC